MPRSKIALPSLIVLLLAQITSADPILKNGDVIALCGDSSTEQLEYSVLVESYLLAARPANGLRVVQLGWSGEMVSAFLPRIGSDVLPFHPTVATLFYGVYDGRAAMTPVTTLAFGDALKQSIDALKAGGVRTALVASPGVVDTNTYVRRPVFGDAATYNQTLATLGTIAQTTAKNNDCPFVDIHAMLMDLMAQAKAKYGVRFPFGGADGIHTSRAGHLVIAYALLKALGCNGDLGTMTLDLAAGHNQATGGHRILSAENSAVRIESRRIPFCFFGDNTASSERSMIDLVPFNSELNRLTLKVINAGPGNFRVTWSGGAGGDANLHSKDFSSDDLTKGINLAAEFPDNPFADAFGRIEKAVLAQQQYESPLVKTLLHSIPVDKQVIPEESATLDHVAAGALAHDKALFAAAVAEASKPVEHTIKIEPVP